MIVAYSWKIQYSLFFRIFEKNRHLFLESLLKKERFFLVVFSVYFLLEDVKRSFIYCTSGWKYPIKINIFSFVPYFCLFYLELRHLMKEKQIMKKGKLPVDCSIQLENMRFLFFQTFFQKLITCFWTFVQKKKDFHCSWYDF